MLQLKSIFREFFRCELLTHHGCIGDRQLLRFTLPIIQLRIVRGAERWHWGSRLIVKIEHILKCSIWICNSKNCYVDHVYKQANHFFALVECVFCCLLINAWENVTESCLCLRIVNPIIHCCTSIGCSTVAINIRDSCKIPKWIDNYLLSKKYKRYAYIHTTI